MDVYRRIASTRCHNPINHTDSLTYSPTHWLTYLECSLQTVQGRADTREHCATPASVHVSVHGPPVIRYDTLLYSTLLYCTVLYSTQLYCTVLYSTLLYCTVLYCTVLYCTVLYCTVLYCTVLYCTVLNCTYFYPYNHFEKHQRGPARTHVSTWECTVLQVRTYVYYMLSESHQSSNSFPVITSPKYLQYNSSKQ